jgi:SSS family solute:Na+ symporter
MIVAVPVAFVLALGWYVRRKAADVADYLVGGRSAGRYLVTVSDGMAAFSLAGVLGGIEYTYTTGFAVNFWGAIAVPVSALLAVTGFAVYRFRETRALTLGQFLEMRYNRRIRASAAALGWAGSVAGYAIFPAVSARFLVTFCGFPRTLDWGFIMVPTHGLVAVGFLGLAAGLVLGGGQIAALATDALQGILSYAGCAIVVATLLASFSFSQFREAFLARPAGESFVNPFDTGNLLDFNILFIFIGIFGGVYNCLSRPVAQATCASGSSPHEQKMAGLLATWRGGLTFLMVMLLGAAAYTFMHHPDFAAQAGVIRTSAGVLPEQLALALRALLPVGAAGALLAVLIFLMLTTDATHLHALGTTLVQDLLLPFRKTPFPLPTQLRLLRLSIVAVAIFALGFALWFEQRTALYQVMALVGSLYLGFAGAVILGGLYWRRGTPAGAAAAMGVGLAFALLSFSLTWQWKDVYYPWLIANAPAQLAAAASSLAALSQALPIAAWQVTPDRFPISGAELGFLNILLSAGTYIGISLLTCRTPFDLDRMLHRGCHATLPDEGRRGTVEQEARLPLWRKLTGIEPHYTRGERILACSVLLWAATGSGVFIAVLGWNLFVARWSDEVFFHYWQFYTIGLSLVIGSLTSLWFSVGVGRDLLRFLGDLGKHRADLSDDGRVSQEVAMPRIPSARDS